MAGGSDVSNNTLVVHCLDLDMPLLGHPWLSGTYQDFSVLGDGDEAIVQAMM